MKEPRRIKALGQAYNLEYWGVRHHDTRSEIEVINKQNGKWNVIAEIKGPHHKVLADYILFTIKAHARCSEQLNEAIDALKLCAENEDLSWEAGQACEVILKKTGDTA